MTSMSRATIPAMRKLVPVLFISVAALTACGESEPSAEERRQAACESFASTTPGMLEMNDAMEVLADEGASPAQKSAALKAQLDQLSKTENRDYPYDCDRPSDKALFEKHYGTFEDE